MNLKETYSALLDTGGDESVYQSFLEQNPKLIPQVFTLNHGVHLSLVFKKLRLAENYVTDFFFVSKSSAEWNLVCVEIEKPSSRYFRDGTDEFHSDFIQATAQINTWRAWAQNRSNVEHLLNETLQPIFRPSSLRDNPAHVKFALVIGRRHEYEDQQRRRRLIDGWQPQDAQILSFDSLLSGYESNQSVYLASKSNSLIHILSREFVSEGPLDSIEPNQLEISEELRDSAYANRHRWRSRSSLGGGYVLDDRLPKIRLRR